MTVAMVRIVVAMTVPAVVMLVTMIMAAVDVQHAVHHPSGRNEVLEPSDVVLRSSFQSYEEDLAFKANAPMQISGVVAKLNGVTERSRLQPEPTLCGRAHHDRTRAVDEKHRAIEKLLFARQGDCQLFASAGDRQQPPPRQIRRRYVDQIDGAPMLEVVNSLGEFEFKPTSENTINMQHHTTFLIFAGS